MSIRPTKEGGVRLDIDVPYNSAGTSAYSTDKRKRALTYDEAIEWRDALDACLKYISERRQDESEQAESADVDFES